MKRAFTLIELLIVVAIIAILAAIAVPNFLEAQVRAKVAKCKADMRTLATGIESYTVDNNRAPIGWSEYYILGLGGYVEAAYSLCMSLSTPVSYLEEVPTDPFLEGFGRWSYPGSSYVHDDVQYHYNSFPTDRSNPMYEAGHLNFYIHLPRIVANGYTWEIESFGPSKHIPAGNVTGEQVPVAMLSWDPGTEESVSYVYDPTNGTTSRGYIIRTNKGEYPAN